MKLRIWHAINVPGPAFRYEVASTKEAIAALAALAQYDLFLGDGEDKPWTTVGARRLKRAELAKASRLHFAHKMFAAYNEYQLGRCPGGVPMVASNVQGCEELEDGEWCEFYDEEGRDIDDIAEEAAA